MRSQKLSRIISCVIFVILLFLCIAKCADLLEYKEARKKYTPFYESKTNFDVVFLGTSHMWNHVLPMEMWDEYGIASYNWGYSNCTPAENYYIIQDIVNYTSPKVVVLDAYGLVEYNSNGNGKYKTDRIEQQHVQFDSFPIWSRSKLAASRDVFDDYKNNEDFIWNFIMYHNRWNELDKNDFEPEIYTEKGSHFLAGVGTAEYTPIPADEKTEIDSVCYPYFLKTIEFCQERGIQVLCTYLPFVAKEEHQRVANSIGDIVKAYPNCTYVNMLHEDIMDLDTDIYVDHGHLNYSGALKTTRWLGAYLRANYDLDDYSNDQNWVNDYQAYYQYKLGILTKQTTLPAYLSQLSDDDFMGELEVFDEELLKSPQLVKLMDNAGIEPKLMDGRNDEEACAHLTVRSAATNEVVSDVTFTCSDMNELYIQNIVKAEK